MRKEEDCEPHGKFLQAVMLLSSKTLNEWKRESSKKVKDKDGLYEAYMHWEPKANEVAVFTMYAYAEFNIPKDFDCIFSLYDPTIYIRTPFVITQSIWEGYWPINYVDDGHKHLCILSFEKELPELLKVLDDKTNKSWKWDARKVLGLCQYSDLEAIAKEKGWEVKW